MTHDCESGSARRAQTCPFTILESRWIARLDRRVAESWLVPWRVRNRGGPINCLLWLHLNRRRLRKVVATTRSVPGPEVSVVIGVRNRCGSHLINSLLSLENQTIEGEVEIVVVDYGSSRTTASLLRTICDRFGARIVRVPAARWSRSHCLNVGIRQSRGVYVLTSDVDILFPPDYLRAACSLAAKNPLATVFSECLDLPRDCTAYLEQCARSHRLVDFNVLRRQARPRHRGIAKGIAFANRLYFEAVGGYDEAFVGWGWEDNDLFRRWQWLGLYAYSLGERLSYFHQWHPRCKPVRDIVEPPVTLNRQRYHSEVSIVRNTRSWGEIDKVEANPL